MFNLFIKQIIVTIAITLPVWLFLRIRRTRLKRNNKQISFTSELTVSLFYLYVVSVLAITIVPFPVNRYKSNVGRGVNFIPVVNTLKDFTDALPPEKRYLMEPSLDNIIGNIILFLPLGFLLPVLSSGFGSLKKIIAAALYCSVSIEFIQLILRQFKIYRTVDIDDVILNVSGAIAGYFIYRVFCKLQKKRMKER